MKRPPWRWKAASHWTASMSASCRPACVRAAPIRDVAGRAAQVEALGFDAVGVTETNGNPFLAAVTTDDHAARRDELTRALSTVDRDRSELAQMWGAGTLSLSEWLDARTGLDARERTLRAELAAIPMPPARVDIGDVRAAWPSMTLDERREILRMFIETIEISPARPGARGVDPERVSITWARA